MASEGPHHKTPFLVFETEYPLGTVPCPPKIDGLKL